MKDIFCSDLIDTTNLDEKLENLYANALDELYKLKDNEPYQRFLKANYLAEHIALTEEEEAFLDKNCRSYETILTKENWLELGREIKEEEVSKALLLTKNGELLYDITQTLGEEIFKYPPLDMEIKNYNDILNSIEAYSKYPIYYVGKNELDYNVEGYYIYKSELLIDNSLPEVKTIKILLHELVHSYLHENIASKKMIKKANKINSRSKTDDYIDANLTEKAKHNDYVKAEVEAEMCSHLISYFLNIDSLEFSIPYIGANYNTGFNPRTYLIRNKVKEKLFNFSKKVIMNLNNNYKIVMIKNLCLKALEESNINSDIYKDMYLMLITEAVCNNLEMNSAKYTFWINKAELNEEELNLQIDEVEDELIEIAMNVTDDIYDKYLN